MAKITKLTILNSADKSYKHAVATGLGAIADDDDPIVVDVIQFPVGSQYTDLTNKKFYVRTAVSATPDADDWTLVGPAS